MTDHNDFQAHLDAHPDDWEYRLVPTDRVSAGSIDESKYKEEA